MIRQTVLLAALGLSLGCGPIQSTALLLDADVALDSARTANAERLAPYEYTAARLYLLKAREEVGYSDFDVAVDFARKAAKFAREAREKALASAEQESLSPPPVVP